MNGKSPTVKNHREIRLKFWGVRGSYPTVDRASSKIGGNTSCVEVQVDGRRLIFDAGTGIIPLGKELCDGAAAVPTAYIFLSHTHIDHVMGLCFFEPLLTAQARTFILGPGATHGALTRSLHHLTHSDLFPVSLDELKGKKEIFSLGGGEVIRFALPGHRPQITSGPAGTGENGLRIATYKSSAHPLNGVMLYRIFYEKKSFVYATDIEQQEGGYPEVIEFARGADLLIHDAQYLSEEYFSPVKPRKGWGHSTIERAIEVAKKARVKQLALFHHEPTHDDKTMAKIEARAKEIFQSSIVAHEGMEIVLR
jgi:phosphoribosyl 1,2-cyclic phosphodiesterase